MELFLGSDVGDMWLDVTDPLGLSARLGAQSWRSG